MVVSKVLSQQQALDVVELVDARHRVLEGCVLVVKGLEDHGETTSKVTVFCLGFFTFFFLLSP